MYSRQKGLSLLEILMCIMIAGIISIGLFQLTYFAAQIFTYKETSIYASTESKLALERMIRGIRDSHITDIDIKASKNFECLKVTPIQHYGIIDKASFIAKQILIYPAFSKDLMQYNTDFGVTPMQLSFSSIWIKNDFANQELLAQVNNTKINPIKGLISILYPTSLAPAKESLSPFRLITTTTKAKRVFVSTLPMYYCFIPSKNPDYDELRLCQTSTILSFAQIKDKGFKNCTLLDTHIHPDPIAPMLQRFTLFDYQHIENAYVHIGYYKMLPKVSDTARLPFQRDIQVNHAFL